MTKRIAPQSLQTAKFPSNAQRQFGQNTCLYFIRSGRFLKIGLSRDPDHRAHQMRLLNPHGVAIVAVRHIPVALSRHVEADLHRALINHYRGREWFEVDTRTALNAAKPIIATALDMVEAWQNEFDLGACWDADISVPEITLESTASQH